MENGYWICSNRKPWKCRTNDVNKRERQAVWLCVCVPVCAEANMYDIYILSVSAR